MLNGALYRQGLRASWKPLVIFLAVLTMYDAVIVSMFDPRIGDLLATLMQTMPDIMAMFGMNNPGATLAEFLANYLYGFLMLIFPLVFSAMTANSLVAAMSTGAPWPICWPPPTPARGSPSPR